MKRLAIITTHPIQYNAPLFRLLAQRRKIEIKVFYTWGESVLQNKYDPGFEKVIEWDIPLLDGYEYQFVENISNKPGSQHFNGIINPTLIKDIENWNANAVLVFGWSFRSHLQCLRYFHKKIPVYFRGDSTLLDENGRGVKFLIKKCFLKWMYRYVDKALYVGQNNKLYFQAFGFKEYQLVFAPHAIENERFEMPVRVDYRKQLSIAQAESVFLFAGKLENKKNPTLLLEAFVRLNQPQTRLIIVGNGQLERELKAKHEGLDPSLRERIIFMDFQNQSLMPDVYKMADVVILPSQGPGETWGLAVNEAMASGRTVLISNKCGCAKDLVIDGLTGHRFESGNYNELESKMKEMSDKNISQKMGKDAQIMITGWSLEKVAEAIESSIMQELSLKSV
jgi:glycosyltransferase involved in cell wall biosynthesis